MKYATIAAALFAVAIAAPTAQVDPNEEIVYVDDYTLKTIDGQISATLELRGPCHSDGVNVTCESEDEVKCEVGPFTTVPSEVVGCDSAYRVGLIASPVPGDEKPGLAIYRQTAPFAGRFALVSAPNVVCRAAGGANNTICEQQSEYAAVLRPQGTS